jgi:hypothetical protein
MPVPEPLKAALWPVLVAVLMAVAVFLLRDVIVAQFITPQVIQDLRRQGQVREGIGEGRFVATDLQEFSENHVIPNAALLDLKAGRYATQAGVKSQLAPLEAAGEERGREVSALREQVAELRGTVRRLEALAETEQEGSIEVRLYISDLEADRNHLVLNRENPMVAHFLKNGERYPVSVGAGSRRKFAVRLEPTAAPGLSAEAAIGRLHREDYHELFDGVGGGIGRATVHFR